jgi:predicted lipid-binding transport protein (Tim44 family)
MKTRLVIALLVLVGASVVWLPFQARKKSRAEKELSAQHIAQTKGNNESLSNHLVEIGETKPPTDTQLSPNENSRQENSESRDNSATNQNSQVAQSLADTIPQEIPRDSLKFVGYATPAAALQSACWAGTKGDLKTLLASMTPESSKQFMTEIQDAQKRGEAENLKEGIIWGFGIQNRLRINSENGDENQITINYDDTDVRPGQIVTLIKIGNEWKLQ